MWKFGFKEVRSRLSSCGLFVVLVCFIVGCVGCSRQKKSEVGEMDQPQPLVCGPCFLPKERGVDGVVLVNEPFDSNKKKSYSFATQGRSFDSTFMMDFGHDKTLVKFIDLPLDLFNKNNGFTVSQSHRQIATGTLPVLPSKSTPYTFLVTSDLEEKAEGELQPGHTFVRKTSVAVETFSFLERCVGSNVALVLMTGDLARGGGTYAQAWQEFLGGLKGILPHSFFSTVPGLHDVEKIFGYERESRKLGTNYALEDLFDMSLPYFGNLFYFSEPSHSMPIVKQLERYHGWFDMGAVRFILLPVVSLGQDGEKEEVASSDAQKKGVRALIESLEKEIEGMEKRRHQNSMVTLDDQEHLQELNRQLSELKRMPIEEAEVSHTVMKYSSSSVVDVFVKEVELARKAKRKGEIQFIVVCGHVPIVTSPRYREAHLGLFEIKRGGKDRDIVRLEECFKAGGIDAYICGHNHVYDRILWNGIQVVTVGFGTQLRKGMLFDTSREKVVIAGSEVVESKHIDSNRVRDGRFIGALLCNVDPMQRVMRFKLVGKPGDLQKGERLEGDVQVYDEFVIQPS